MDDQEIQRILLENNRLAKENNRLLGKLYKFQRWQRTSRVLYWLFMAALALGAYYYVQPYIKNVQDAYDAVTGSFQTVNHNIQNVEAFFGTAKE